MPTCESETKQIYTFKSGMEVTVIRKYKDNIHPGTGGVMNRSFMGIEVNSTGRGDVFVPEKLLDEIAEWYTRGCKPPLPQIMKDFNKEN